jgi:hypothetical protein
MFHQTHGFCVHGISIESATLPEGWQQQAVAIGDAVSTAGKTGLCVEAHDLAASKFAAHRPKDKEFVRQLLIEKMIDDKVLAEGIGLLQIEGQMRVCLMRWVNVTTEELKHGGVGGPPYFMH